MSMTKKEQVPQNQAGLFFIDDEVIVHCAKQRALLPFHSTLDALQLTLLSLQTDQSMIITQCTTALSMPALLQKGYRLYPIKPALLRVKVEQHFYILRAYHWLNWTRQSQYCGQCGHRLTSSWDTTEKTCHSCQSTFFPRFSPAVMVLIQKGDDVLLARSPHFPPGDYSALAGFIDVGESAEQAVHREVKEEVGLSITNLTYFSTQTWPFPDSFMIAFTADYQSGTIQINQEEIEDARWFHLGDLPPLSPSISISRQLINAVASSWQRNKV